jgi:hypothetical protein
MHIVIDVASLMLVLFAFALVSYVFFFICWFDHRQNNLFYVIQTSCMSLKQLSEEMQTLDDKPWRHTVWLMITWNRLFGRISKFKSRTPIPNRKLYCLTEKGRRLLEASRQPRWSSQR